MVMCMFTNMKNVNLTNHFSFPPKQMFIGKSKICPMTEFSGANDSSDFDGKTILPERGDNEYFWT